MKKSYTVITILFVFALFVMPAMAADDNSLSYDQFFKPAEGVKEVKDSPFGTPINKLNNYIDGFLVFAVVAALAIALIKLVWGNPEQASDGYRRIGGIVLGVLIFMCALAFVFTSMGWKF